jgi:hypothetical protein
MIAWLDTAPWLSSSVRSLPPARPHNWIGRLDSPRKGATRGNFPAKVTGLVGALTVGAKRGALTAAPGLSRHPVYSKAVIVRTVTISTSVETAVDAGPDHLVELEILGVAYGKNFRGCHDF